MRRLYDLLVPSKALQWGRLDDLPPTHRHQVMLDALGRHRMIITPGQGKAIIERSPGGHIPRSTPAVISPDDFPLIRPKETP